MGVKNCKKGMYECIAYSGYIFCICLCYKYNNLCKYSFCVVEKVGILKEYLDFLRKLFRRRVFLKSVFVEFFKEV